MEEWIELEDMAQKNAPAYAEEPSEADGARWCKLFGFVSIDEARNAIKTHRADPSHPYSIKALWRSWKRDLAEQEWDKEAFVYWWMRRRTIRDTFLLKLEGPLKTVEQVQSIAREKLPPVLRTGVGEKGAAHFCEVDGAARDGIYIGLARNHIKFWPDFTRLEKKSKKELDKCSIAPTLGQDATMPQFRATVDHDIPQVQQGQYPVWYFFYGDLAQADILTRRLGLIEPPKYTPAIIHGGRVRFPGISMALVDDPSGHWHGCAFLVESKEQEDFLRHYETNKYEIVRCSISMQDTVVQGLCFRFAGPEEALMPVSMERAMKVPMCGGGSCSGVNATSF